MKIMTFAAFNVNQQLPRNEVQAFLADYGLL